MNRFEELYDAQGSERFSPGRAAAQRGTYSRFLDSAGSGLSTAAGQMGRSFAAPQGTNALEQSALADSLEETTMGQFGSGLGQLQGQMSAAMGVGSMAASTAQNARFAKEAAQLRARTARQDSTVSALSSGLSALGGIFSALPRPGSTPAPAAMNRSGGFGYSARGMPLAGLGGAQPR